MTFNLPWASRQQSLLSSPALTLSELCGLLQTLVFYMTKRLRLEKLTARVRCPKLRTNVSFIQKNWEGFVSLSDDPLIHTMWKTTRASLRWTMIIHDGGLTLCMCVCSQEHCSLCHRGDGCSPSWFPSCWRSERWTDAVWATRELWEVSGRPWKAEPINIFIDNRLNVKGVSYSDETTDGYPIISFLSALWARCFVFLTHNVPVLVQPHRSHRVVGKDRT